MAHVLIRDRDDLRRYLAAANVAARRAHLRAHPAPERTAEPVQLVPASPERARQVLAVLRESGAIV